jgi:hypothetical protein
MLKYNRAQFWLFFLLFIFVMFDIFMTSVGIYDRHVASEASPLLSIYILHSGSGVVNGLVLALGGIITTVWMLALAYLVSRIQKVFSMEFFISMLILMHFLGILNWLAVL